jgi:hypothetical protein
MSWTIEDRLTAWHLDFTEDEKRRVRRYRAGYVLLNTPAHLCLDLAIAKVVVERKASRQALT